MEHKIFLGKYRVAGDEMALAASDPTGATAVAVTEQQPLIATIYRGEELETGRDVSVEVIPAAGFKPAVREELEAEAAAGKKINHINIPALYDFGVEDDQLIYVTEHFDGTTAEEWVNTHGPMPTGAVLRIASQVVSALGASALHRISHHAINPSNVLLVPGQTPEGDWPLIKVLHFVGVAPSFSGADLAVASFDKTTHYASPEQLREGKVDFRSEVYSLGATMWFLLTGTAPMIAPRGPVSVQPEAIGFTVDKLNGMPKRVQRLLAQMLSLDPERRPQDPLAFYRQIQECLAQLDRRESMARRFGIPLSSESKTVVAGPGRRRLPAKALALAAILLALATIAGVVLPRYLHHERVKNAEVPIGVPIGVPDATVAPAQAPPTVATTNSVQITEPAPTIKPLPADSAATKTAQTNTAPPPAPANSRTEAPTQTAPVVAANQPPAPPQRTIPAPAETAPPVTAKVPEQPKVAANETRSLPEPQESVTTQRSEPARSAPEETSTKRNPRTAANETRSAPASEQTIAPKPDEPVRTEPERPIASTRNDKPGIADARAVAPEVRRAEAPPPSEGPDEAAAPAATTEKKVLAPKVKKEHVKKPARQPQEKEPVIARAEPVEDQPAVEEDQPQQQEQQVTQLPMTQAPAAQMPRGRTKARFIGVTADGNWMFSLPSKKIVIVPPPPGG
ncbi:MAG: protein kinase domain-containing protein [Chthoniobacterales bacterium]